MVSGLKSVSPGKYPVAIYFSKVLQPCGQPRMWPARSSVDLAKARKGTADVRPVGFDRLT